MLLVEEPENGLTPTAVAEFYAAVRALAYQEEADKRSQVLISSHRPFVICDGGLEKIAISSIKSKS